MAKARKPTLKQLDKIMDEAARAWRPGHASTVLITAVSSLVNTQQPAAAVAHALVHELTGVGLDRRAVYVLLMALSQEWEDEAVRRSMPGPAWERLHCDNLVADVLATWATGPTTESTSTESVDHEHDD